MFRRNKTYINTESPSEWIVDIQKMINDDVSVDELCTQQEYYYKGFLRCNPEMKLVLQLVMMVFAMLFAIPIGATIIGKVVSLIVLCFYNVHVLTFVGIIGALFILGMFISDSVSWHRMISKIKNVRYQRKQKKLLYQLFNLPVYSEFYEDFQFLGAYLNIEKTSQKQGQLVFDIPDDRLSIDYFNYSIGEDSLMKPVQKHRDRFTKDDIKTIMSVVKAIAEYHGNEQMFIETQQQIDELRRIREKNGNRSGVGFDINQEIKVNDKAIKDFDNKMKGLK